ncbi:MAG: VPLPA-CTERM sorting domain-containing protein [Methylophaga sp.]|nr:VPLPA-CTERM sorting domain-containing protein [Methylophaga sp.]
MKKAMLFFAALLFSVSAHAAVLDLTTFSNDVSTNTTNVGLVNQPTGAFSFNQVNSTGAFQMGHIVVAAVDTVAKIQWTFNQSSDLITAQISKGGSFVMVETITGLGTTFNFLLLAGQTYFFDIIGEAKSGMTMTLGITAVPLPAAVWLLAPALLGFFGMRRRAMKVAAA